MPAQGPVFTNQSPKSDEIESPDGIVAKKESKVPPSRQQNAEAVRTGNYLPIEEESPTSSDKEVRRPTFGLAAPAMVETDPAAPASTVTFGFPKPMRPALPKDLFPFQGNPSSNVPIALLIVRDPPPRPAVMAAMKARLRRPHFLDAPIATEAIVVKPVDPLASVPEGSKLEIVQIEPPDELPSAIQPFVLIQVPPKGLLSANTAALLEPIPQFIIYRQTVETAARPRADLGPPVTVDP
jgi:hypothetical protein